MTEKNYWVIIPPPIVGDKDLPSGAKLVFGRVFALVSKKGYCYASNAFLGKDIGLTKGTVSEYLSRLAKRGYLQIELIRDKKNRVKERRIYTYLSNSYRRGIQDPIQLKLEKSIERKIKRKGVVKGMESLKQIVDNISPKYV